MDEIIIDDKKYIPSKQAAEITGYAKDYIGQLCREGKVPARLVGRSWYVLETAIRDHRFGSKSPDSPTEAPAASEEAGTPVTTHEWGSIRYEAAKTEILPSVGHSKVMQESEVMHTKPDEGNHTQEDMHKAWQEWFSHVTDSMASVSDTELPEEPISVQDGGTQEDSSVPLHIVNDDGIAENSDSQNMAKNIGESDIRYTDFTKKGEEGIESVGPEYGEPVPVAAKESSQTHLSKVKATQGPAARYPAPRVSRSRLQNSAEPASSSDSIASSGSPRGDDTRTGQRVPSHGYPRILVFTIRFVSLLTVIVALAVLALGTGAFDTLVSHTPVGSVAGIYTYFR